MHGWWAISYVVLWLVVVTLCVIVVALARQIGALHLRLGPRGALELDDEGPALGEALPASTAADTAGSPVVIGGAGEAQFLLFVSPGCPVCDQVLPSVAAIAKGDELRPYVLVDANATRTELMFEGKRIKAPVVPASELAHAFAIPGTPYAVVLDDTGVVRTKGTVNNLEQMEGLVRTALRRMAAPELSAA